MLDLCLATTRFHPVYAGPGIRFRRYAPGLRERGIRLRVFSAAIDGCGPGDPERSEGELCPPDRVDQIPVQRVRIDPDDRDRMRRVFNRALVRYLADSESRPDVMQHFSIPPTSIPSYLRVRRMGIPQVHVQTMMRNEELVWYKRAVDNLSYRAMDCVVVSSTVMRDQLRETGVSTRVEVIPNGVELDRFRPLPSAEEELGLRRELGFEDDETLVVFVGGYLSERKGIDVLAEAWDELSSRFSDARLVLVGPRLDELKDESEQSAFHRDVLETLRRSGALDRVSFTGRVDNVEEYLQVADVFVFPSRREGMPNVVPEAYACGAPVVLTPFEGLPEEFGEPGRHHLLVSRTPGGIAAGVSRVLEDAELRASLEAAARSWVEETLDVERSLDRYAELYRDLA